MYLQSIETFQTSIWSLISEVTDILNVLLKTNELILLNSSVPLSVSLSKNLYCKKQKWKFEITFFILHGESPPTQLPIQQQSDRTHPPSLCLMTNHPTKKCDNYFTPLRLGLEYQRWVLGTLTMQRLQSDLKTSVKGTWFSINDTIFLKASSPISQPFTRNLWLACLVILYQGS